MRRKSTRLARLMRKVRRFPSERCDPNLGYPVKVRDCTYKAGLSGPVRCDAETTLGMAKA